MSIYCTYLTTYFGSKLPMFYIGSTSVEKVKSGYHGSVMSKDYKSIYESELKQNPQLFKTKILRTFYIRGDAFDHEAKLQRFYKVDKSNMYFNKAIAKRKFNMQGLKHSDETKCKMRKSHQGKNFTQEHKDNLNKTKIGRKHRSE